MDGYDKKLALELNSIEHSTFDDVVDYFAENAHWHIYRWEIGTTGGGSSGAPLLDSEGRIIGILSGGEADCDIPVNDYFADIKLAWSSDKNISRQLKYWLDPDNILNGKSGSYRPFNKEAITEQNYCDTNKLVDDRFYVYPVYFEDYIIIFSNLKYEIQTDILVTNISGQFVEIIPVVLNPGDNIVEMGKYARGFYIIRLGYLSKVFKLFRY